MSDPEVDGIPCLWMRGTSKGVYFIAHDLPTDKATLDDLLLRIMDSPPIPARSTASAAPIR